MIGVVVVVVVIDVVLVVDVGIMIKATSTALVPKRIKASRDNNEQINKDRR